MHMLLVEDDPVTTAQIEKLALDDGIVVEATDRGEDALEIAKIYEFDLAIIDIGLPDLHGSVLVNRMRAAGLHVPIMMLSARHDDQEKVRALTNGADDYVTKPYAPAVLKARWRAIVRRARGHAHSRIEIGRMIIDLNDRRVEIDGKPLKVTSKEFSILELMALRKGKTLTKEHFLDHLYGGRDEPEQKIIDVFICKLRKKIQRASGSGHGIQTVWGSGYMLTDPTAPNNGLAEDAIGFAGPGNKFDGRAAAFDHMIPELDEFELLLLALMPDD